MNKSEMVRARISPTLKRAAENVLGELGLSASEAITLFYTQVALRRKLPLDLDLDAERRIAKPMTASQLLRSDVVGQWRDRDDIKDSSTYARRLRDEAQNARMHSRT
jgi:DNA-damage-inducible protein J